jgi:hypothetical protein
MVEDDLGVFAILKPPRNCHNLAYLLSSREGETGKSYCQTLANVAGTEVIAADASQIVTIWQGIKLFVAPYGNVDDFEGTVYSFTSGRGMVKGD